MCGFIGQIAKDERSAEDLLRGLKWIHRRGPDSQKLWSSPDKRVSLLHARLAIVDSDENAHQPFSDISEGVTIAFVGEIYNYPELKSRLSGAYTFRTNSDTEVILAVYITHGIDGLSLLKGTFSLAIVDERQKKIILARDPIGKKPLFYARWDDRVLFGVSLLPLVSVHGKSVKLDNDAAAYFWRHSHINPQRTILRDATPVGPGEVLEFDWFGQLVSKNYRKPKPLRVYNGESQDEVIENIAELLTISVRRRLSDNPCPAVLLSGGIDSTVVTSFIKKVYDRNNPLPGPRTLSLASLVPFMNDEFYATYAARRLGIRIEKVNLAIDVGRLGELITRSLHLQDEPLGMPSFFLLERLVKAMSGYGKILLSGDGGDEVFLGYGKPADWHIKENIKTKGSIEAEYGPEIPFWMSHWARETVTDTLLGHMFPKAERASAEQGVELRCPLVDWDLVSYARSLPFEILVHGKRTKALLKDQLEGWPHWFLERPKLGFAYNLRWLWGLSKYSGLREGIDRRALMSFEEYLPKPLLGPACGWRTLDIFRHFQAAWQLLSWSLFLARLDAAEKGSYVE